MTSCRRCQFVFACVAVALSLSSAKSAIAQCDREQLAKLRPEDRGIRNHFGESVSLRPRRMLIGARWDNERAFHAGAAYVFEFSDDGYNRWEQRTKLLASDGAENDQAGYAVALHGTMAAVAAPWADPRGADSGAVYVFWEIGPLWIQGTKLTPPDGAPGDRFGWSVAAGDRLLAIGASSHDQGGSNVGAVYVYDRNQGTWIQEAKLLPADPTAEDRFGAAVAIEGDRIIVGAPGDDQQALDAGAAYVFERDPQRGEWTQRAKLVAADGAAGDQFGLSVALDHNKVMAGAPLADNRGQDSGSAYVFRPDPDNPGEWIEEAKLVADDGVSGARFGASVALQGATAVIGAKWDFQNGARAGAAYVFTFDTDGESGWRFRDKLLPDDARQDQEFGGSVSAFGDSVVIGAGGSSESSAYVFPLGCCDRNPDWLCDGDVDGDGQVNPADVGLIQAHFGDRDLQALCNYDLDCDQQINPVDAGIVQSLMGTCAQPRYGCDLPDRDGDRIPDVHETDDGVYIDPSRTGTDPDDPDTDGDGIKDGDEVYGTEGGLDLPALGASPVLKDIFLEIDWLFDTTGCEWHSHEPSAAAMQAVREAFAAAPVPNPYAAADGIRLHIDHGQGPPFERGSPIGIDDVVEWDQEFNDYKAQFFDEARKGYFHYAIFCHRYNRADNNSSGIAETGGDDFIVSLQCALSDRNVTNTTMHELGHNLGLSHSGNGGPNFKPNYNSIMNYRFQFAGVDVDCDAAGDGVPDFSHGRRIVLDENHLDETQGVCGLPINWDGGPIDTDVARNINCIVGASSACGESNQACPDDRCEILEDHDDWSAIVLGRLDEGDLPQRPVATCQDVPADP